MRAGQRAGSASFTLEALDELGVLTESRAEHLDGDTLAEPDVTRLEDDAHAALPKDPLHGVLAGERGMALGEERVLVAPVGR